jgi:very-short-patch-repair endonuclease
MSSPGEAEFLMHCSCYKLTPILEFTFAKPRKWRFDFAFTQEMVAVEIEGGTRHLGRHNRHSGFESDCAKYNEAAILGWKVLRFTTEMVAAGTAIDTTLRALGRTGFVSRVL